MFEKIVSFGAEQTICKLKRDYLSVNSDNPHETANDKIVHCSVHFNNNAVHNAVTVTPPSRYAETQWQNFPLGTITLF